MTLLHERVTLNGQADRCGKPNLHGTMGQRQSQKRVLMRVHLIVSHLLYSSRLASGHIAPRVIPFFPWRTYIGIRLVEDKNFQSIDYWSLLKSESPCFMGIPIHYCPAILKSQSPRFAGGGPYPLTPYPIKSTNGLLFNNQSLFNYQ